MKGGGHVIIASPMRTTKLYENERRERLLTFTSMPDAELQHQANGVQTSLGRFGEGSFAGFQMPKVESRAPACAGTILHTHLVASSFDESARRVWSDLPHETQLDPAVGFEDEAYLRRHNPPI